MANWHPLAETIVGKPEVWEAVRTDWKEVFGRGMLEGFADPAVGESMTKIMDLMVGPQGGKMMMLSHLVAWRLACCRPT